MVLRFTENVVIKGQILVRTGMHIGGLKDSVKIGGVDSPVVTVDILGDGSSISEKPYIPGSSLKGRMRNLLTNAYGKDYKNGLIEKIFGKNKESEQKDESEENRSRAVFRDAYLSGEMSLEEVTEIKGENQIDPVTARANPRFIQRVIPGSRFDYEIILTVYEGDNEDDMVSLIKEGFELLKDSYIGGNGTRGYGRIDYTFDSSDKRDRGFYEKLAKSD